jgi:GNAT superfamily N-acetyltransferase
VDQQAVLTAFDERVRQRPEPDGLGGRVERDEGIVRCTGGRGWIGVVWANLDAGKADDVIVAQIDHFASAFRPWEWKHYSYDSPADLPERLMKAGFRPEPMEALLAAELVRLSHESSLPIGVELRPVTDERGVEALMQVHTEVFGEGQDAVGEMLLTELTRSPARVTATMAIADERPIAAGWVQFHRGTDFASLWGGCTVPAWRGRGVFRALVARRVAQATNADMRYLVADAAADSRPIFRRLGFVDLATTTPYVYPNGSH